MINKKKILVFVAIILSLLFIFGSCFLIYFFTLNKELDLSLIKTGASSVTKIHYFDYENREYRIGKAKELEEEEIFLQKSEWCSIYDVPKNLINAFIAVEDKRFYEHSGVDFLRTGKAIFNYIFGKDKNSFGGSTITQQLIKNLTGENQTTPKRKAEEILRALNLETKLSKNEIMELYLNIIYLSENCYGVNAASEVYFGKNAKDLTLAECATLAAIVKNPSKYNPYRYEENNISRRNVILTEMYNQGLISLDEYQSAKEEKIVINKEIENKNKSGIYSWFTETLINDVSKDLAKKNKISYETAKRLILKGGLNIYSTIDPSLQKIVEDVYENYSKYILPINGKYPESSCVIIDPKTSDVLAIAGGVGKKNANMIFNRAIDAKRPPGSVIKPLSVYAPALDLNKITYSTVYDDTPVEVKNGVAWPKNSPNRYRGLMPIYYAVEHSVNTVAVKVLKDIGRDKSLEYLDKFMIKTTNEDRNEASLALGQLTNGESLINITNAYSTFANKGSMSEYKTYLYVTDNYGNVILEKETNENKVISPDTASIVTKMLENVVENGTASSIKLKNENVSVAGKTGTSSNNEDRWFIGYSPDYLCGVWTGFDTPQPVNSAKNPSCIIFNEIFDKIYNDLDEASKFEDSVNIVSKDFCFDSGKTPTEACTNDVRGTRVVTGYFKSNNVPRESCNLHKETTIDITDGLESRVSTLSLNKRKIYLLDYKRKDFGSIPILDSYYLIESRKRKE